MSSQQVLDLSKIPKFEFQVNNDQLKSCIKQLHFQSKTNDKHVQKIKKDIETKPSETAIADAFTLINANIEIDPALLRQLAKRNQNKNEQGQLVCSSHRLGAKIGQMSEVLGLLFEKMNHLQKKMQGNQSEGKNSLNDRCQNLQHQIDEFHKSQNRQNRQASQSMQLNINKYEQKLREVQSKTLWQINDCKTKLNDRVNEQFVRDIVKTTEAKLTTKVKQSLVKSNIDPERINKLENVSSKLGKDIDMKFIEVNAKFGEVKESMQHTLATKKELIADKLDTEKKIGNLQVQAAELARKGKNYQMEMGSLKDELKVQGDKQEEIEKEVGKIGKVVGNLKISDDFQKLMQNLDPHKICEIDNTLSNLEERDLKIQRQIESMKRDQDKFKQKVEICNMLTPNEGKGKLDKEDVSKIFVDLVNANPTFKKVQTIQGQLYEFRAYGDMINQINKRIGKIQKEFDIQGVIYNIKGLEEYIKKELLMMNSKIAIVESGLNQQKKRRPLSARKTSDGKMTSSISYKKLTPVDCISCFQNPMSDKGSEQRKLFGNKY